MCFPWLLSNLFITIASISTIIIRLCHHDLIAIIRMPSHIHNILFPNIITIGCNLSPIIIVADHMDMEYISPFELSPTVTVGMPVTLIHRKL